MTGKPSFTFRDADEKPDCGSCGGDMDFHSTRDGTFNEMDVYGCRDCGTTLEDRWTF